MRYRRTRTLACNLLAAANHIEKNVEQVVRKPFQLKTKNFVESLHVNKISVTRFSPRAQRRLFHKILQVSESKKLQREHQAQRLICEALGKSLNGKLSPCFPNSPFPFDRREVTLTVLQFNANAKFLARPACLSRNNNTRNNNIRQLL